MIVVPNNHSVMLTGNTGVQGEYDEDKTFGSKSYSVKRDVKQIQMELMTNGPVEAAFTVFEVSMVSYYYYFFKTWNF